MNYRVSNITFGLFLLCALPALASAAPPASPYEPGETLAPSCEPGSVNCSVRPFAASGANSDITSLSGLLTPLDPSQGGTGLSTYVMGDLLYATGPHTLGRLGLGGVGILSTLGGTPSWQATSTLGLLTSDLIEQTNLFFTNARADSRISATSTIATLQSLPNLSTVGTVLSGVWRGSPIDARSYISHLDDSFSVLLGATTTDALLEGATHKYYSDDYVLSLISGLGSEYFFSTTTSDSWLSSKTTDSLTEGVRKYFTNERVDARINATTTLSTLESLPNLRTIGTIVSGVWQGSPIDARTYLSHLDDSVSLLLGATTTDALSEGLTHKYYEDAKVVTLLDSLGTEFFFSTSSTDTWFSEKTTDHLAEGVNKYFSNARADARINATSTIGTLQSLPNLASVGTITSGLWNGSPIDARSYISNLATPFAALLGATSTDALSEGISHKYYSDSQVLSLIDSLGNEFFFSTSTSNSWLSTKTTDNLTEGTRKYFTDARADARINATSTISTLTSLPGLSTVGTVTSGVWQGSPLNAATYLSNFGTPFYSFFSATTSDALSEGVSHPFYSDNRVGLYISSSSTIPHISGGSLGNLLSWDGGKWISRATSTLAVALGDTTGLLNNSQLSNSSVTVSAGSGLAGGATIALGGTGALSIDFTRANSWSGLQQFLTASTSALSVTGPAYFGSTGTSTFSATGDLTLGSVGLSMVLTTTPTGRVVASSTPVVAALFATSSAATSTFAGGFSVGGSKLVVDRITGNVGINTASPTAALSVGGKVNASLGFAGTCYSGSLIGLLTLSCNQDVAESYPTYEETEAGDVVGISHTETSNSGIQAIGKADSSMTVLGVVSTNPGLVFKEGTTYLAGQNDIWITATSTVVALTGRVPVKVSLEHGPIAAGDELTLSSTTPGVAVRLTGPGMVLGIALQSYEDSSDSLTSEGDPRILLFVNRYWSNGPVQESSIFTDSVQSMLDHAGAVVTEGIVSLSELIANTVTTHTLCLDDVCITKDQLRELLEEENIPVTEPPAPPEEEISEPPSVMSEISSEEEVVEEPPPEEL
jgi:hypothetical protein